MSPQETQVLQNFLDQLVKVQGVSKDAQAQSLIGAALSRQPDAGYLLVQRALLLEQALAEANSQLAGLQSELRELQAQRAAAPSGNFFDPAASGWGNSAASRPLTVAPANPVGAAALPPYGAAGAPLAADSPSGFFGGGNVLGTMAATAAGVAAGAFLFQGLSHLSGPGAQHADQTTAQLDSGNGELLPGYFEQDTAAPPDDSGDDLS